MLRRENRWMRFILLFLVVIAVSLAIFLLQDADTPEVILAPEPPPGDGTAQTPPQNPMAHVEITAENVQEVIATLERPAYFSREISKTRYWSGGTRSATTITEIWSIPEAMRIQRDDGENMIFTPDRYYIWFTGRSYIAHPITAAMGANFDRILDEFQGIPSYETVLDLDRNQIIEAGYTLLTVDGEEQYVIYVEVRGGALGYVDRYYISLFSGLLVGVETWDGDIVIYRMETLRLRLELPDEDVFTLPGGRNVLD